MRVYMWVRQAGLRADLLPVRWVRVALTDERLRLHDGQASAGLACPEAFDILKRFNNLFVAELLPKGGHGAF